MRLFLLTCAILSAGCTPSLTERVSSDVARTFVDAGFPGKRPEHVSVGRYFLAQPAIRRDAISVSSSLGRAAGRALASLAR